MTRTGRRWLTAWSAATAAALLAAVAAVGLTGLSAWFLGAVALAGGVAGLGFAASGATAALRLFALARPALKYAERLLGHRAALNDQSDRRAALFAAIAASAETRGAGWQLDRQDRLTDFIDDVEHVDFGRLRVDLPLRIALAAAVALIAATAVVTPVAGLAVVLAAAGLTLAARRVRARCVEAATAERAARRSASGRLGGALAALAASTAEGRRAERLDAAAAPLADAVVAQQDARAAAANLDALAGGFGPAAALAVLIAAWTGEGLGPMSLALAFCWIAFAELLGGAGHAALGAARRAVAAGALARWSAPTAAAAPAAARPRRVAGAPGPLSTPDGAAFRQSPRLTLDVGAPTALIGASGAGKTTLLKMLAGWAAADAEIDFDGAPAPAALRRASTHLALHDAAVIDADWRRNLFTPDADDPARCAALDAVELLDRVAAAGGLDARIDPQDGLSLGERQRIGLARAWLSASGLVLIDEPGAHLDRLQGPRILERLLDRLSDRIVVFATHDPDCAALAAETIRL